MNFILSVNIRGLGAYQKFLALKNFFMLASPKIMLIQETMHGTSVTVSYFRKMFPLWHISAVEANSLSGGLVVLWIHTGSVQKLIAATRAFTYQLK